jgi:hypothetical protein
VTEAGQLCVLKDRFPPSSWQYFDPYVIGIAALLADLREALAGGDQASLAEEQARKLKNNNPTLHKLTSELCRQGLL